MRTEDKTDNSVGGSPMSEVKAFFIAVAAALVILGLTFGVSALMHRVVSEGTPPQPESTPGPAGSPAVAASPIVVDSAGKGLFADNCASCHGDKGEGSIGPNLHKRIRTVAEIAAIVTKGVGDKMPAYGDKLKPNEIQSVAAYAAAMGGK